MSKSIFSLDVRRARKGDCLILHYGTEEKPGLALIDGGPGQVYKPFLRPRLVEIRKKRGLGDGDPLPVDLLMVSHIDDDHIKGILELTQELVDAGGQSPPLVKVGNVWHNSFDDIIGNDPQELLSSVSASFGVTASLLPEVEAKGLDGHAAKVLASVAQGQRLRDDTTKLKLGLNREFKGKLIMASGKTAINMQKGLKFTVVGPMKQELAKLQEEHDKFLKSKAKKTKKATASFTDESAANLSSIVVLAEVGKSRMLLTGDARGDKILEGLELEGLLKKGGKMHVDILKVPHHGSDRNMETVFFERVTADHYVFSGDGEHGNPERATLQMLLDARKDAKLTIHLTYPIDEIDSVRKAEHDAEVEKKAKEGKKKTPWSDAKDSLKSFFVKNPAFAKKVEIVDKKKPHVIDLLPGKVGF
ncbi:MAG: hypothetical protein B7Z47_00840 [Chthoniobacter sp. 12-60-6]|nr:MAG: hypothetical protein B7Z47_00840 [Chthoniobacter sp. 12-60-6]